MDHETHLVLAYKLLQACDCDKAACIYSLLPAIDREPAHYHRVYGHILQNQPKILDAALELWSGEKSDKEKTSYEHRRIAEDTGYFRKLLDSAIEIIGDQDIRRTAADKLGGTVALISHVYFDTFNNPVQAFLPDSAYCSAQWDFWESIDYLKFRAEFYEEKNILSFRRKVLSDPIWDANLLPTLFKREVRERLLQSKALEAKLDPFALVKAMIIRLGEMAAPEIEYSVIDWAIREFLSYLGSERYYRPDKELVFCVELEKRLKSLITASLE